MQYQFWVTLEYYGSNKYLSDILWNMEYNKWYQTMTKDCSWESLITDAIKSQ